jgi:hypothetical protein
MKNKKILSIVGVLAVIANLGLASIAFGQTTGQVAVGCGAPVPPSVLVTNPAGVGTFNFDPATYGAASTEPIAAANSLVFEVTDSTGFDPGLGECANGILVTMTLDDTSSYFSSLSTLNDNQLDASGNLSIGATVLGTADGTADLAYTTDDSHGVNATNILTALAVGGTFTYAGTFTPITVLTSDESFDGTVELTYAATDMTLDVANTVPVDTYTKEVVITATRP